MPEHHFVRACLPQFIELAEGGLWRVFRLRHSGWRILFCVYFLAEDFLEPPWIFALPMSKATALGLLRISFSNLAILILPPLVFNPGARLAIFNKVLLETPRISAI